LRIVDLLVDSFVPPAPPLDEKAFAVVVSFIKLLLAKVIARFEGKALFIK
jgi:hypothetical protein